MNVDAGLIAKDILGSIGDKVFADTNKDGKQDIGEAGVDGIKVILWNSDASGNPTTKRDSTVTAGGGLYLFSNLPKGDYVVQFIKSTIPAAFSGFTSQSGAVNDPLNSDANVGTGITGKVSLDPALGGLSKDNLNVDAGLIAKDVCVPPTITITSGPTFTDINFASLTFTVSKAGIVKVNLGTLTGSGTGPYTVTQIPQGKTLIILDSLAGACKKDTSINIPIVQCPNITILTTNQTICKDSSFTTLQVALSGVGATTATADWYANATGGTKLASGLSYKPAGLASVSDTFYVAISGTDINPVCKQQPRTPVIVKVQDCTKQIDLALKKLISKKTAKIGDNLVYTIKVWNESKTAATGVEVTDSLNMGIKYVSSTATRGSYNPTTKKWTIGNIAANGDTVTLNITVTVLADGVWFNTAEISKANEKDIDSTPGNGKDGEDDIDRQCFSVPIKLCAGQIAVANIPANYTGIKWFKGTQQVGTGNSIELATAGTYTFTATSGSCPAGGCCPIVIETIDCCPAEVCVPFTIKKTKKGGKPI